MTEATTTTAQVIEIGGSYSRLHGYFIGLDERTLITVRNGEFVKVRTRKNSRYKRVTNISIQDIARHWGVSVKEIDATLSSQFKGKPASAQPTNRMKKGWAMSRADNYYKCDLFKAGGFRYNPL